MSPRNLALEGWLVMAALLAGAAPAFADAKVGEAAPAFTLTDTDGRSRALTDWRGKIIVLEWSNHECPFVRKHYGSGNMQRLQATYTGQEVIWLTILSSAPGKQGHVTAAQAAALTLERGAQPTAVLLDPDGAVGRRYGAKTTPHMFIINAQGVLAYAGAIDDRPSADPADIAGAANYVQQALEALLAGRPISTRSTKPYGCSVKY
jgi:peroxiredoxin